MEYATPPPFNLITFTYHFLCYCLKKCILIFTMFFMGLLGFPSLTFLYSFQMFLEGGHLPRFANSYLFTHVLL